MKKQLNKRLVVAVFAVAIFFTGTSFKSDFFEIAKQIEIFTTLFKELNMNYVDDTNPADLMDTAIKGMLDDLDPYTRYMNEQDVEAARINNTGDYTGIGARIRTLKDRLVVIEPYKDYPADKAGLKAGDEIIKINNIVVADFKENSGDLLKGSPGSKVEVTFVRQGETKQASIVRQAVEVDAVPLFTMADEKTGYIALTKFNRKASSQTIDALQELKTEGAERIILDLRGNPGGLLSEAVNVSNIFIPKGQLVVTTKSKVKKFNKTYYTKRDPVDDEIPLVVIIDGGSASASEIVAGSLQDLDRAVIVGARSFGKGLVQRPKKLTYGTQLKVTISRYYTPSGRCIQALDYWNRDDKGNATRVQKAQYNEFKTRNGRPVFDGGGVKPDVEIDLAKPTAITKAILGSDLIFDYATKYHYENQVTDVESFKFKDSDFNAFKTFLKASDFSFETKTEKALDRVISEASNEGLDDYISSNYRSLKADLNDFKDKAINNNKAQLTALLENEIVKRYFYREGLYQYYIKNNLEINTAKEILGNSIKYQNFLE
ncbi:MAG: S41 family peptidase [Bacteroidia bacterium]|nr:S41 family peptidase [Bacteroidia bacterium]NND10384.1 S41 family peptidase [Flavobacteriaceae bacterium]MBT8308981.1 S41 family peptidase [Bacteroidia bacterium]NNK27936.1 S41 family peptidase [Flavobacteriaceae bacterium]NNL60808.1 S41 family peptidase [Flavobacteriaceae bacterium]